MKAERWTVMQALRWTADAFAQRGIESARREAELLLGAAVKLSRVELYTQFDRPLSVEERGAFRELIKRRSAGEPVQYILGHQPFWTLDLKVTPAVLIPRADTEVLVEEVLAWARREGAPSAPRIVDVGTGTGAIALALARELEHAHVWAIDVSAAALAVAQENASTHGLAHRVCLCLGSLLEPVLREVSAVDVVVSNPPYISTEDMAKLPAMIARFEPHQALHAGPEGLDVIRPLVAAARIALTPGGLFACEIGTAAQAQVVCALVEAAGFAEVRVRDDHAHTPRAVVGLVPHEPRGNESRR